ncbi:MAG: hypothetical protein K8S98_18295 [Planctomycetes bacterium]|nr:hypothetical protein [Planctomycetota bacterium]
MATPAPVPTRRIGGVRLFLAFAVAIAADTLFAWTEFMPVVGWLVDFGVALALFVLLGFRWALLPALVVELIPGLALFPTWTLAVTSLALFGRKAR